MEPRILEGQTLIRTFVAGLCLLAFLGTPFRTWAAVDPGIATQIRELLQEKENRTPVQRKIDSQLLYAVKAQRGERLTPSISALSSVPGVAQDGTVLVDVTGTMSSALLGRLPALGAAVIHASVQFGAARLKVPLSQVENLAGMPEIHFVQPAAHGRAAAGPDAEGIIAHGLSYISPDVVKFANLANINAKLPAPKQPIKIGVLSDSIDNIYGDLAKAPPWPAGSTPQVIPNEGGLNGDLQGGKGEGLAMLEIVNAIAPGAELLFATATGGVANMADNIVQLSNSGCQIIVDDYLYFSESPFQDGPIALAADQVVDQKKVFYFSASANNGNLFTGNSGTWEGPFSPGGPAPALIEGFDPENAKTYTMHEFAPGQNFDVLTTAGDELDLFWSDPLGHSRNDYDLFLLNAAGTKIEGASTNFQTGDQDPFEYIVINSGLNNAAITTGSDHIVIVKDHQAAPSYLHLATQRGRLLIGTAAALQGHCAARSVFCVGAANAALPAQASRPFIFSDLIEGFSSDGFRRIFFNPKGRPYSPENLWTGGIRLSKPDFAAADGVTTTLNPLINSAESSLSPFFGSSAAAPQIAGIAALLRAIDPAITPGQMRRVLTHSCVDLMQFGVDRESGFGAVRADLAVQNLKLISHKYAHLATTAPPEDQDSRGNR